MNLTHVIKVNGSVRTITRTTTDGFLLEAPTKKLGYERLQVKATYHGKLIYTKDNGRIAQQFAWLAI